MIQKIRKVLESFIYIFTNEDGGFLSHMDKKWWLTHYT